MCPLMYVQRVTKHKLNDADKASDSWPEAWVHYSEKHPQYTTHVQVVRDVSNPRIPHPVAVLVGYTLPPKSEDPELYSLIIMTMLTGHSIGGVIKMDMTDTWEATLDRFMKAVKVVDPHRHQWITDIVYNMQSISNGRAQQQIERVERERLMQEQGLVVSTPDGPNNYDPSEHNEAEIDGLFNGEGLSEGLVDVLPEFGPWTQDHKAGVAATLALYDIVHPSRQIQQSSQLDNFSGSGAGLKLSNITVKETLKVQSVAVAGLLANKKAEMYSSDPARATPLNVTGTVTRQKFSTFIKAHNLDEDQSTAFITIAEHIINVDKYQRNLSTSKPDQMIFYLGGEGGTGKSKVLKALVAFLSWIDLRHSIRMGAKTGSAAANIGGSTLHSLLSLKMHSKKKDAPDRRTETYISEHLKGSYENVNILFIDEVSMISCEDLHDISKKLTNIKCIKGQDSLLPFGGMTTILAGDFYQLRPFAGCPLYENPGLSHKKGENFTKSLQGFRIFSSVTHVVFLKTQYRMEGDKEYMEFVKRFRSGNQDYDKDAPYLAKKVITPDRNLSTGFFKECPTDPIIIVATNELRYHINMTKAAALAKANKQKLYFSVARDMCTKHTLGTIVRRDLLLKPDGSATGYGAGLLPLVVGMPIMIKANIATELNVCNGSMGVITRIILDERERVIGGDDKPHYCRYEPVVYVKLPDCQFQIPGLGIGELPMSTVNKQYKQDKPMNFEHVYNFAGQKIKLNIRRKQLWFLPAFAITVDSSQGRTLAAAIIDLSGHHKAAQKPYVMLSRLNSGMWLGIQSELDSTIWNVKPNATMLKYIKTLQEKEKKTSNSCKNITTMDRLMKKYFQLKNPKTSRSRGVKRKPLPNKNSARKK